MSRIYKVRHKDTGLFLHGDNPHLTWDKEGRSWNSREGLRRFLNVSFQYINNFPYSLKVNAINDIKGKAEVVGYELVEEEDYEV